MFASPARPAGLWDARLCTLRRLRGGITTGSPPVPGISSGVLADMAHVVEVSAEERGVWRLDAWLLPCPALWFHCAGATCIACAVCAM